MAESGLRVDDSTIACWVLRYAPILQDAFSGRCGSRTGRGGSMKSRCYRGARRRAESWDGNASAHVTLHQQHR